MRDIIIDEIRKILEKNDGVKTLDIKEYGMDYAKNYEVYDMSGYNETQMLVRINKYSKTFDIRNVYIKNKRQGCLTEILELIKDYAMENGYNILIESVLSKEMLAFCKKNNFKLMGTSIVSKEGLMGSYILTLP